MQRLLLAVCLLFVAASAQAAEEILLFDSEIAIGEDGVLTVTETIEVRAEGQQIKRGIYRDFPIGFEDADGRMRNNSFKLTSVTRDGEPDDYRVERGSKFVRVYIGKEDVLIPPGVHSYRISYRTDRQLRQFDSYDELYWNVTGTEWLFPILKARAEVTLPADATSEGTTYFTGGYGSREQNARATLLDGGHRVLFETTRPLGARKGLTIAVKFQKGVIAAPTRLRQLGWFLRDHADSVLSLCGLIIVLGYYLWAWVRVGRDPRKGITVPRWSLPDGVSAALAYYIWNKGLPEKAFPAISAAAVSLAVKGYVTLDRSDGDLEIRVTDKPRSADQLPTGEAALMRSLAKHPGGLKIVKANGEKVKALTSGFRSAMETEHRQVYYKANLAYIAGGILLSILTALAVVLWGGFSDDTLGVLIPGLIVGGFATATAVGVGKRARTSLAGKLQLVFLAFIAAVIITNSGILTIIGARHRRHTAAVAGGAGNLIDGQHPVLFSDGGTHPDWPTPNG